MRTTPPLVAAILLTTAAASMAAAAAVDYGREIAPILRTYCSGCHNDRDREGELSVERFASLRKGGAGSGDPVVPGDAAASVMIQRIQSTDGDHMPPDDEPQVPAAELATLVKWIGEGAPPPAADDSILESLVVPRLPPHVGIKPVTAVACRPDGGRLAVARGRTVDLFDLPAAAGPADLAGLAAVTGTGPALALENLPGRVTAAHFSGDGRQLVIAGGITGLSGVAELREASNGGVIRSFGGHRDLLYDAELSPDGKLLATAGYDRSIRVWSVADGTLLRTIDVHNGPVFDLAWHPTGRLLASASADETVKLWRTADGVRLDTLKEPQAEVFALAFTPDGRHVIAAGRDKRIHLWELKSLDAPAINPSIHSRFAHESQIVAIGLSADGKHLLTSADDRSLKCWSVPGLILERDHPRQSDLVAVIVPRGDGRFVLGRMDGSLDTVGVQVEPAVAAGSALPPGSPQLGPSSARPPEARPHPAERPAADAVAATITEREPDDTPQQAMAVSQPVVVKGTIGRPGDADCFRFAARVGDPLLLEVDAARSKSKLDSRIEVLDALGNPVEQVVLQATRDSWFTFRGKDSAGSGDFRLQNWSEMELDEYLYANGEVVRLWQYPEGPDSGFAVYPGEGSRQTFFGTSAVTHALGEPAWIVAPLPRGSQPAPNGLPVFRLPYENDDEPTRRLGTDSQVLFTAPSDGDYVVRVTDVRGFGPGSAADDYHYSLTIRGQRPSFSVAVSGTVRKISPGSGRELTFRATRSEGFEGPIRIDVGGLPAGFTFHGPLEIEAGQLSATGVLSAAADAAEPDDAADKAVWVRATATVPEPAAAAGREAAGRAVVQEIGGLGDLQLAAAPKITLEIVAGAGGPHARLVPGEPLELSIRPGETISAKVRATRHDFKDRIRLGGFGAGRNLPHGVFIDNLGLNGLMIVEGTTERKFFITASPIAKPGRRLFHLRTLDDDVQVSLPAVINVLPE